MPSISHTPREPVALTSDFTDWLVRNTNPEELGEAWECAQRCAQRFDARRNASFRTYFLNRWKFRRIDLLRQAIGRRRRGDSARRTHNNQQKRAIAHAYTNAEPHVFHRRCTPADQSVELWDAIAAYKRRCKQRSQAMIIDCLASGLTYRETGAALGVCPERVYQHVKNIRGFIGTAATT